jgi:hypothetical protein
LIVSLRPIGAASRKFWIGATLSNVSAKVELN